MTNISSGFLIVALIFSLVSAFFYPYPYPGQPRMFRLHFGWLAFAFFLASILAGRH